MDGSDIFEIVLVSICFAGLAITLGIDAFSPTAQKITVNGNEVSSAMVDVNGRRSNADVDIIVPNKNSSQSSQSSQDSVQEHSESAMAKNIQIGDRVSVYGKVNYNGKKCQVDCNGTVEDISAENMTVNLDFINGNKYVTAVVPKKYIHQIDDE